MKTIIPKANELFKISYSSGKTIEEAANEILDFFSPEITIQLTKAAVKGQYSTNIVLDDFINTVFKKAKEVKIIKNVFYNYTKEKIKETLKKNGYHGIKIKADDFNRTIITVNWN